MKRKPYPAYKPSGVEWVGDVPAHWEVKRIGHTTYVKGRIGWQGLTSDEFVDEGPLCVTGTDFIDGKVNWGTCYHVSEERYSEDPFIQLREKDLLITKDGTIGKTAVVNWLREKATLNSGIFLTRPFNYSYNTKFMYWILNSSVFDSFINLTKTGTTIAHLYQNVFVRFYFPLPSPSEQQAIADFLDRETGKIDTLIGKNQRLIELLKEKRMAQISRAVTKGLDPTAKTKPSGVEWLGEVPEHWEVKKLKYLCNIQTGDKDTIDAIEDGNFPFFVRSQTVERIDSFTFDCEAVLTAGDGVGVGKVFHYVNGKFDFHQRVYMFNKFRKIVGLFFFYFLRENFYKVAFDGGAKSTVDSLRMPMLAAFWITLPPLSEQHAIVDYIDQKTSKIDALIAKVEKAIEKLKEYRIALISAAVTGKIDVREAA